MTAIGSLIGLLVIGWPLTLAAQPTARFALSWNGPPGCPTAEDVQARVDALLGGGASAGRVADVRASGQVERVDNGFRLLLSMGVGSTPSSRVIQARTCEELAGAAAIAIALLARSTIEGASAAAAGDGTAPVVPSAEPKNSPPVPASSTQETAGSTKEAPAETRAAEPAAGLHLVVDAPLGVVGWGSLPSVGLGVGAGLGLRWKAVRVTVSGELWKAQREEASGFSTRFTLQSGRAEACLIQAVHGLELGPCIGAAAQALNGEGVPSSVFVAKSQKAMWISGSGGLFMSAPMPGFSLLRFFGEASVLVSPRRPSFVIDQLGPVHRPALAAPQLHLGCEWIF